MQTRKQESRACVTGTCSSQCDQLLERLIFQRVSDQANVERIRSVCLKRGHYAPLQYLWCSMVEGIFFIVIAYAISIHIYEVIHAQSSVELKGLEFIMD